MAAQVEEGPSFAFVTSGGGVIIRIMYGTSGNPKGVYLNKVNVSTGERDHTNKGKV